MRKIILAAAAAGAALALTACDDSDSPEPQPSATGPNDCPQRPCELPPDVGQQPE